MRGMFFIFALIFVLMPFTAQASSSSSDVSGYWYTEGHEGVVRLYHCGEKICGRFHWLDAADAENESRDSRNPDPGKREQPLCQMQFMGDFTSDRPGHYRDGWIYSPRHGQTFSAEMTLLNSNTLSLHGYLLLPLFGEDQVWTRARQSPASCASDS